jgi:hypothetical protein
VAFRALHFFNIQDISTQFDTGSLKYSAMSTFPHRSRDEPDYDLSDAVYGTFPTLLPSRATTHSPIRRSRAPSPAKSSNKRCKHTPDTDTSPLTINIPPSTMAQSRLPGPRGNDYKDLHQSTCLNLNVAATDTSESDLWILPDFDDWEFDAETPQIEPTPSELWSLLRRAARSNRERLRARLEGDGWDFVGGKYVDEKQVQVHEEGMVDEEFDVVVLPRVRVSC